MSGLRQGKYVAIPREDFLPALPLRCDVLVHLPLNNRMVRIRLREQFLDESTLQKYASNGHSHFFIVHPQEEPAAFDFLSPGPLNPKIPEAWLTKIASLGAEDSAALMAGSAATTDSAKVKGAPGEAAEAGKVTGTAADATDSTKVAGSADSIDAGKVTGAGADAAENARLASAAAGDLDAIALAANGSEQAGEAGSVANSSSELEPGIKVGADAGLDSSEQRFSAAADAERARLAAGGAVDQANMAIGADAALASATQNFSAATEAEQALIAAGAKAEQATLRFAAAEEEKARLQALGEAGAKEAGLRLQRAEEKLEEQRFQREQRQGKEYVFRAGNSDEQEQEKKAGLHGLQAGGQQEQSDSKKESELQGDRKIVVKRDKPSAKLETWSVKRLTASAEQEEDEAEEAEKSHRASADESEAGDASAKSESERSLDKISAIATTIEGIEENLVQLAPDRQEEIEELRTSAQATAEESEDLRFRTTLPEDSPRLKGLKEPEAAAVKLTFAMSKRLDLLRGELRQAMHEAPDGTTDNESATERKRELHSRIRNFEESLIKMEFVDELRMAQKSGKAGARNEKSKKLVQDVANRLKELRESNLLPAAELELVQRSVERLQRPDQDPTRAALGAIATELKTELEQTVKAKQKLSETNRQALNESIATKTNKAVVAMNVKAELASLRRQLVEAMAPTRGPLAGNAEERKAAAVKIQAAILGLEEIAEALDGEEEVAAEKLAPFQKPLSADFTIQAGEDPATASTRIQKKITELEEEATRIDTECKATKDVLEARLNGEEVEDYSTFVAGDKSFQASIYALLIAAGLGYRNEAFRKDLAVAVLLSYKANSSPYEGRLPYPARILRALPNRAITELPLRDASQIMHLARAYTDHVGTITGRYSMDTDAFARICKGCGEIAQFDDDLLERARQNIVRGLPYGVLTESQEIASLARMDTVLLQREIEN